MSFTRMYLIAYRAQKNLCNELDRPDPDLRRLVGHGNLLDDLNERMVAERDGQGDEGIAIAELDGTPVEHAAAATTTPEKRQQKHPLSKDGAQKGQVRVSTRPKVVHAVQVAGDLVDQGWPVIDHVAAAFSTTIHSTLRHDGAEFHMIDSVLPEISILYLDDDDGYESDVDLAGIIRPATGLQGGVAKTLQDAGLQDVRLKGERLQVSSLACC